MDIRRSRGRSVRSVSKIFGCWYHIIYFCTHEVFFPLQSNGQLSFLSGFPGYRGYMTSLFCPTYHSPGSCHSRSAAASDISKLVSSTHLPIDSTLHRSTLDWYWIGHNEATAVFSFLRITGLLHAYGASSLGKGI